MNCKRTSYRNMLAMGTLAAVLSATPAFGKRVVCISVKVNDQGNQIEDRYLSSYEGWIRNWVGQNPDPEDEIIRGGNLTDCLRKVNHGDTLIIIAHSIPICDRNDPTRIIDIHFKWGPTEYTGFGVGAHPVPPPDFFNALTGVHVQLGMCRSDYDPDGPEQSLAVEIIAALGGDDDRGNVVTKAYKGRATTHAENEREYNFPVRTLICTCGDAPGDCACRDSLLCSHKYEARVNALPNEWWADNAPTNRPGLPPNTPTQLTELYRALSDWLAPYPAPRNLDIKLIYKEPTDVPYPPPPPPEYFARTVAADCNEPCGEMTFSWKHPTVVVPALSEWGMVAMAALMLAAGAVVVSRRRAVA